jgi:hypothetical protein
MYNLPDKPNQTLKLVSPLLNLAEWKQPIPGYLHFVQRDLHPQGERP